MKTDKDVMTNDELRQWAEKVKDHSAAARGVLRLLAELNGVAFDPGPTSLPSVPPIPKQFDGSTGTPPHGKAGHIGPEPPGAGQ